MEHIRKYKASDVYIELKVELIIIGT